MYASRATSGLTDPARNARQAQSLMARNATEGTIKDAEDPILTSMAIPVYVYQDTGH